MLEALCRQSSTTLDILHAEDGPPTTQRTSGLEPRLLPRHNWTPGLFICARNAQLFFS